MALCVPLRHLLPLLLQLLPEIHITLTKWQRYTSLLHSSYHTPSCVIDPFDLYFSWVRNDCAPKEVQRERRWFVCFSSNGIKWLYQRHLDPDSFHFKPQPPRTHGAVTSPFSLLPINTQQLKLWFQGVCFQWFSSHLHRSFGLLELRSCRGELINPGFGRHLWHLNSNEEHRQGVDWSLHALATQTVIWNEDGYSKTKKKI